MIDTADGDLRVSFVGADLGVDVKLASLAFSPPLRFGEKSVQPIVLQWRSADSQMCSAEVRGVQGGLETTDDVVSSHLDG